MRKKLLLLFLLITVGRLAFAQSDDKLQLAIGTGYQKEDFHWSIAGNADGQNPNVYSELKWHNVAGEPLYASAEYNIWNRFWIMGSYSDAKITSGTANDTDYGADNRTNPVYNENFSSNKGSLVDWSAGIGYSVIQTKSVRLLPAIGYGENDGTYYLLGTVGDFATVNSYYKANWKGPFVKVLSQFAIIGRLSAVANVAYSQLSYNAVANWNLIENFQHPVSFRDNADAYGLAGNAGLIFAISKHIDINGGITWFNQQTGKGNDQLYLTDGSTDNTRMNGAFLKGTVVSGGIDVRF